ncbi:phage major tail tube protein [Candidatus Williamhamiltonella defendens]|uniref:Phage major tail tube protein n=1 Tax=Candidatus Williamhamiltonella defendens TaxID=138072 RepID=A0A2D3TFD5_9ENTR|nr:phage major tail tube protein [Candidatus Hamiltonella defensa]ATW34498.1 phage major tail tube protein [Candidatus Hamiltonella defensa]
MFPTTLKNMNLYIDGKGYAGVIEEITLPKLTLKSEEFRGGGMDAPIKIDMGMEHLETGFTLKVFDKSTLTHYGLGNGHRVIMTIRGGMYSDEDGAQFPVVIKLQGMITEMDFGTWKAGESGSVKATVSLRYYHLTINGEEVHEIDINNMVRKIDGVDYLAQTRRNIGL